MTIDLIEYKCPVCFNPMEHKMAGILHCPELSDGTQHATYYLSKDRQVQFQIIEVDPYQFSIDLKMPKTTVRQKHKNQNPLFISVELILTMNVAINLPWHDPEQVINKVKTYLVFQ